MPRSPRLRHACGPGVTNLLSQLVGFARQLSIQDRAINLIQLQQHLLSLEYSLAENPRFPQGKLVALVVHEVHEIKILHGNY